MHTASLLPPIITISINLLVWRGAVQSTQRKGVKKKNEEEGMGRWGRRKMREGGVEET